MRPEISNDSIVLDKGHHRPLYPILYRDLWQLFKKAEASFWTTEAVDIHQDKLDWSKLLSSDDRVTISRLLASFAISSCHVSLFLTESLLKDVIYREAKFFFARQLMMENTHFESVSMLIDQLVGDPEYAEDLFRDIHFSKANIHQRDWLKGVAENGEFGERLMTMMAAKKLFSNTLHSVLFWFKKMGMMPGLSFWNELINRDEKLHADFTYQIYMAHTDGHLSNDQVRSVLINATEIAKNFTDHILHDSIRGLSVEKLKAYSEYQADHLSSRLGHENIFNIESHPVPWLDSVTLHQRALSSTFDPAFQNGRVVKPSEDQKAFDLEE